MKKILKTDWVAALLLLGGVLFLGGCSDAKTSDEVLPEPEYHFVTVLIDDLYMLDYAGEMKIRALHFAQGDKVFFKQGDKAAAAASDEEFPVELIEIGNSNIRLRITPRIASGEWSLYCRRDTRTQYLATTRLEVDIFRLVRNVRLDDEYVLDKGDRMTVYATGFEPDDKIFFSQSGSQAAHYADVNDVNDESIVFSLASSICSGEWDITCERGSDKQLLGTTSITVTPFPFIDLELLPEDMNAYGRVYCGDRPLEGVCVSDGVEIVRTDAEGVYAFNSQRLNGTLFVSLPSGYEAPAEGCVPQFYHLFKTARNRYDFPLAAADQSSYVLLASADIQIDNSTRKVVPQSSLKSCEESFVPAYRKVLDQFRDRKVYNVSLGDMVYDKFWYSRHYGLPEYKEFLSQFGSQFFHIMGNHDNDPYCAGDLLAEHAYKEELGPTYYSLNIGAVHYIALDNIRYINTGGSQGIVGQTNYAVEVTARQIEWLKKDLATVDPATPVVVWMHAPLINLYTLPASVNTGFVNQSELATCFDGYRVLVLSGHRHTNHKGVYPGNGNLVEHGLGSVCGALWHNVKGFNGTDQPFGAAIDGTPAGFGVYQIEGSQIKWHYQPCDAGSEIQFTAYDMNRELFRDKKVANEILVNVWDWDEAWRVEITENGNVLSVKHEIREDPNYLRFMATAYAESGEASKNSTTPLKTPHMFSAVTAAADSPVQVKVTDRFGRVYTRELRP